MAAGGGQSRGVTEPQRDWGTTSFKKLSPKALYRSPALPLSRSPAPLHSRCRLSAFRNAWAESMESVGMVREAPQERQVSLMPSSVTSAS